MAAPSCSGSERLVKEIHTAWMPSSWVDRGVQRNRHAQTPMAAWIDQLEFTA